MPLKIYVDFALTPELLARLKAGAGPHQLILPRQPATVLSLGELEPTFYEADVVFGQPEPAAVAKAASLKWIQVSSSGITRYDTPDFRAQMAERQIAVTNSAHVYNEACAEQVLSFMLAQSRLLVPSLASRAATASPDWQALRAQILPLRGRRVLILGFGAIGRRLAELLAPFHMQLAAYRRNPRGDEGMPVVSAEDLPAALAAADHIVNILPDSDGTRDFFDSARLAQCKPGAVFYNIGRGSTVDQNALAAALAAGPLAAAWLDVTTPEPLPEDHPLRHRANCFITPHTAGGFHGEGQACLQHFLDNLARFQAGQALLDRVL